MTGVSWPQSNIPGYWQGVSWLFPSTFGARAYVRMNSMGATLSDVMTEYRILWLQAFCYFVVAMGVYRFQIYQARYQALERLRFLQRNRKARQAAKAAAQES